MLTLQRSRLDEADALELIEQVQRYYIEIYGGPDDDPLVPAKFAAPEGGFVVGRVEELPVAMGGWTRRADQLAAASIRRMFVAEKFRRRGFAEQVLDWIEADARDAGIRRLMLSTGRLQPEAISFYRASGFTDIEPFGFYAASIDSAVFLGKDL